MFSTSHKVACLSLLASLLSVNAAPGVINLGPAPVNLGTAANYAILSQTGVSTVPPSSITGDIAVSPISGGALTGFALTLAPGGAFSTSSQVTGDLFAASYAAPTPVTLRTAISDMQTAFSNANGLVNPGFRNLAGGSIGGLILTPALYRWTTSVSISDVGVTISGTSSDVFVFQIAGTFDIASDAQVILVGGALASNIFWVVTGAVTVHPGAHFEGVILAKTGVTLQTGATMNGRILSQTLVALQSATVVG
ncbi:ice-binding protein [Rhodocollybia butyracea]|uniref:Ice-binding protein n=1 Tax=Rhodocollybia butyracea TaxID=206335 RepID=A0A9P5PV81_9AGAR|nr:ice-binding protein [Rhodocollybia butyracea]